jgi:hypothetical protein
MVSKAPSRVKLEQVFVRECQRRVQPVMDLLEQELRQSRPLGTRPKAITVSDYSTPLAALHPHVGGDAL